MRPDSKQQELSEGFRAHGLKSLVSESLLRASREQKGHEILRDPQRMGGWLLSHEYLEAFLDGSWVSRVFVV